MSDFFRTIVKELNDENTTIASDGMASGEFGATIDTGAYILNAALSGTIKGGIPNNKVLCFAGESATGKTFFALGVVKRFLTDNPSGGVFYFDTEAAVTKDMMEERGVDTSRVIISEPESVQQFRHNAIQILDNYIKSDNKPPMLMVLDSLGQLSTSKELEDTAEGKETRDMTRAQVLKATFRVLTLKLAKAKVPLIVTNHVYEVVGSYIPTKEMSGGSGLKYTASQIVFLSKKKDKDGKDVVGNIIKCKMVKSRFTKENKEVEVKLTYDKGLDRYYGLLDLALKYGIFKQISTRIELPDGTKTFGKSINKDPKKYFTPEILEKIDQAAITEYTYGKDEVYDDDGLGEDQG
jgi:RecA/RadA recombinase|tara:strand:+ start:1328 stop:2380 length:1053 start_codon:yes stop_codon:yes gene_type:complete